MKKTRWIFLILAICAISVAAVWRTREDQTQGSAKGSDAQDQSTLVTVVKVVQEDIPIWLSGIGTVQAFNTVTVRPRVSGNLDAVHFDEGKMVKAGEVLAQIDPRPYKSALAQVDARKAQNEAQLRNAEQELTRLQTLVKNNAVSQQSLDQAEATVAQFKAMIQADDAAIAAAQLDLDFTQLRSPISGRAGIRQLDAGNIVTANQAEGLVTITQIQPINVVFTLPQRHLPSLQKHMRTSSGALEVQAHSESGELLDTGKLQLLDNQIDASTGTLRLKAEFENKSLNLWPGQFVTARLLIETRPQVTVVPSEVVQPGLDGPFAYVVKQDSTVEARPVKQGLSIDGKTLIEDGLQPGEQVVKEGQSKLKPGARVSFAPASKA